MKIFNGGILSERVVWNDNFWFAFLYHFTLEPLQKEFPVAVFPMCETEIGQAKTPPQHNALQPITHTKKHTDSIRSNDNQILPQL